MADMFIERVKTHMKGMSEEYLLEMEENYNEYLKAKGKEGYSQIQIERSLDKPENIALRYSIHYKAYQLHGKKKLTGARNVIREAVAERIIGKDVFHSRNLKLIFQSVISFAIGSILAFVGAFFFFGNIDNVKSTVPVVFLSVFLFMAGIACYSHIPTLVHKCNNDLLGEVMQNCDLKSFGYI